MLAALGFFDLLSIIVPFVVAFLFWRRVGRFMNLVETRLVSIDEHLERIAKTGALAGSSKRRSPSGDGVDMSDRDRALLELAAQHDRERAE